MIIDLPKEFTLKNRDKHIVAKVEDGMLFFRSEVPFKHLMKELTYAMYGKATCYYCYKTIKDGKSTIDHIIPQDIGGPTITNNLLPACRECNLRKGNKTLEQYEISLHVDMSHESLAYIEQYAEPFEMELEDLKRDKTFSILGDWVTFEDPKKIWKKLDKRRKNVDINTENTENTEDDKNGRSKKYLKKLNFFKRYKRLQKAILLDKNCRLLGGYTSLKVAIDENLDKVPVIILENVEVVNYYL